MTDIAVDIVVPVWNFPVDTRRCINSLSEYSPQARLILVDNGSDRETERLLEEFAEILDHRALLLKSDANLGFVRGLNHGLARGEARHLAVVRTSSVVSEGWLDPLVAFADEQPDAGLLLPTLVQEGVSRRKRSRPGHGRPFEADHGSFSAMVIRRQVFEIVGGIDEHMDSSVWCLRNYSRRAWKAGFRTVSVPTLPVSYKEESLLGSVLKRQERVEQSVLSYRKQWGEEGEYFLHVPKQVTGPELSDRLAVLLEGARQGSSFILAVPRSLATVIESFAPHENISWFTTPPFLVREWVNRLFRKNREGKPQLQPVEWGNEGIFSSDVKPIPFPQLRESITETGHRCYRRS